MSKTIVVKTNDPSTQKFYLKVQGPVAKVVDISPSSVYMEGAPGDTLTAEVRITPSAGLDFSIEEIALRNKTPLKVDLVPPGAHDRSWILTVAATSDSPASLYDVVQMYTSSEKINNLSIRVFVTFRDTGAGQTGSPADREEN